MKKNTLLRRIQKCLRGNWKMILIVGVMTLMNISMILFKAKERKYSLDDGDLAIVFGIFLLLNILAIGILILAKVKAWRIERIYLVLGLILGLGYMILAPVSLPSDEIAHFARVYELSEGRLFQDSEGNIKIPENLAEIISHRNQEDGGYQVELENFFEHSSNQYVVSKMPADSNLPFSYLPHILGVLVGKILSLPLIPILLLCRLLGLISCTIIMYFCIKYIPCMKKIVFMIGLLPTTMLIFAGVTVDGLIICAGTALVTYVLYTRKIMKRRLKWTDFLMLLLICLVLVTTKVVYAPMCLLLFWIPKERFSSNKLKIGSILAIGVVILVVTLVRMFCTPALVYRFGNPEARLEYIMRQPLSFLVLVAQTIGVSLPELTQSAIGRRMGGLLVDTYAPYAWIGVTLFAFLCAEREKVISKSLRIVSVFAFVIATIAIYGSMFVIHSDLAMKTIEGVHGRYFLAMAMLIPIMFAPSDKQKKRQLVRPGYLYIFLTLMNVYMISVIVCSFI